MKKIHLIPAALAALAFGTAAPAHAIELTVLGGLNLHSSSVDPEAAGTETGGGTGAAFGALIGWEFIPAFGLETGALFVKKDNNVKATGTDLETSHGAIEVPLMLRFTALPILSVGGGLVYTRNSRTTSREGTLLSASVNDEIEAAALKRNEWGARLNARIGMPLVPLVSAVLDLNYVLGLSDIDLDPNASSKTREFQVLVGASIGF